MSRDEGRELFGEKTDSLFVGRRFDQSNERQRVFSSAQVMISINDSCFCCVRQLLESVHVEQVNNDGGAGTDGFLVEGM